VQTSFAWFPSTTYCPTYLTVPSSIVIVRDPSDDAPIVESTPARETIVAGSNVVSLARATDRRADALGSEANLAAKYVELGDYYFKTGRFRDAAEAYGKARHYAPDDPALHFVLADAVFALGDYHYAAFLIAEAVRLDPTIVTAVTEKRRFYGDARAFDDQMQALERYLEGKPYDAQAQLVLGYNLRFSDRPAAATAAFLRVVEIDPDNRAAVTFLKDLMPADPAPKRSDG
jgi:tetratricopeptide (TPR) repeat protein